MYKLSALLLLPMLLLLGGCPGQNEQADSKANETVSVDPPVVEVEAPPAEVAAADPSAMPAPEIIFTMASGAEGKLSDYRGKPVVVNFWAEW